MYTHTDTPTQLHLGQSRAVFVLAHSVCRTVFELQDIAGYSQPVSIAQGSYIEKPSREQITQSRAEQLTYIYIRLFFLIYIYI